MRITGHLSTELPNVFWVFRDGRSAGVIHELANGTYEASHYYERKDDLDGTVYCTGSQRFPQFRKALRYVVYGVWNVPYTLDLS